MKFSSFFRYFSYIVQDFDPCGWLGFLDAAVCKGTIHRMCGPRGAADLLGTLAGSQLLLLTTMTDLQH